jgi:hypothetical protein
MTAWVLVLAGVTAGDGGMRAGAASAPLTEPLRLDFSRDWEGTVQGVGDACPVRLSGRRMTIFSPAGQVVQPFALTLSHGGLAVGSWGEGRFHGTYKVEGDRVLICVESIEKARPLVCDARYGLLYTLKPAARRP